MTDEICTRYRAGESGPALAERYGMPVHRIHGVLRARGVPLRSPQLQRHINRDRNVMQCAFLYHNGRDLDEIAAHFRLSPYTIRHYLHLAGYRRIFYQPGRNAVIRALAADGASCRELGARYGVSYQRIHHIIKHGKREGA